MLYFSYVLVSVIYQHTSQLAKNSDIVTGLAEKWWIPVLFFHLFLISLPISLQPNCLEECGQLLTAFYSATMFHHYIPQSLVKEIHGEFRILQAVRDFAGCSHK